MKKKTVDTYWCYFLIGNNRGYDKATHISLDELIKHVISFQKQYSAQFGGDAVSLNISVGHTVVFQDYYENCYRVEAINYPRYPKKEKDILKFMIALIEYLIVNLEQNRISLISPTKTVMIEA